MTYVFDKELFLFWDILQKQLPGVSEGAFLKSLELFSKRKVRVSIFITGHCPSTSNSGLEVLKEENSLWKILSLLNYIN